MHVNMDKLPENVVKCLTPKGLRPFFLFIFEAILVRFVMLNFQNLVH